MITRDKCFYLWFVHWWTPRTWTKLWWLWQHCKVQSRVDLEQFHLVQRPKSNGETTWLPKYWADIACKLHLTIRISRLFLSILFRHLLQLLRQPENNWKITKYLKQIWNWKNVASQWETPKWGDAGLHHDFAKIFWGFKVAFQYLKINLGKNWINKMSSWTSANREMLFIFFLRWF